MKKLSRYLENLFKLVDVIVLIGRYQVGHGQDLDVILVWFCFLGVEWIDTGLHEHVGQH